MLFLTLPEPAVPSTPEPDAFGPVAPYYDELMAGVPYDHWLTYLELLWHTHHLKPRKLLDLACGTGTLSRLFVDHGYQVTGVDLAAGMLDAANEHAAIERKHISYFQQDAAELDLPGQTFDAVYSVFDSLNYILDPERLQSAFQRVCQHLEPGGSFVFDVNTEYALSQGMFNQSSTRRHERLHYRWRSRWDAETHTCTVRMTFSYDRGDGQRQTFKEVHRQRAYSKEELTGWLRDAGFAQIFLYDAYTTKPPRKRSDRLHVIALKG